MDLQKKIQTKEEEIDKTDEKLKATTENYNVTSHQGEDSERFGLAFLKPSLSLSLPLSFSHFNLLISVFFFSFHYL